MCIAGVAISVTMFISMVAMMEGFEDKFIIETVESSGHISVKDEPRETRTPILERAYPEARTRCWTLDRVKPRERVQKIDNPTALVRKLERMPGIVGVAPEVYGDVIATYGTKTMNLSVFGVDPDRQVKVTTIGDDVLEGGFARLRTTADGIILGKGVADVLGPGLDDNVSLSSSTGGKATARVVGIFRTGITPVDYSRAYMFLNNVQTLVDKKNVVNEIVIRTDDYTRAEDYAAQIESLCGYRTESWQESNANFLKIFSIQTLITYIITAALLVVAAFGVLNILIMAVLERVNDIAILKSIGLSRWDITVIYLYQGLLIGLIGSTIGLICGKLTIEVLRRIPCPMEG